LGGRPLVLDREFSYRGLLEYLTAAGISIDRGADERLSLWAAGG